MGQNIRNKGLPCMNFYIDNSRTEAEKDRDWFEMMRALHLAINGPRLLVPALSDSRLQDPSKPSSGYSYCATMGDLMKASTIHLKCYNRFCGADMPFRREYLEQFKDEDWGPDMSIKKNPLPCPKCKSTNTGVFVSYSGLPHGEVSGRLIGVKI
ncbi:MAG: hypothetical protein COB78_10730 [Hyphomicrobiales bacterium]|nr:MAG: hypothetical protein COB78_10730 [Hyphomicrobiales bacterium]